MKQILDVDKVNLADYPLGDSQSLYFTPSGTPMRDMSMKGTPVREDPELYSPTRSPEKGKKGHKRMVSNLSTFLPFWWGMNQQATGQSVSL